MDPQQKQLLQCVYRALEDAGVPMEDASGTRTGVFFGTAVSKGSNSALMSRLHVISLTRDNKTCSIVFYCC